MRRPIFQSSSKGDAHAVSECSLINFGIFPELCGCELLRQGILSEDAINEILADRGVVDGLKITLENDFLAGTDIFYTNGIRAEISFNNPAFEKFFKSLGFDHSDFFIVCGQEIYNTSNNNITTIRPGEPPNAGMLHCGGGVNGYHMDKEKARIRSMSRLEAQMGAIGKKSYAEQIQNGFHNLLGDKAINWQYQLNDRFYFNIDFQHYQKVAEGSVYGDSRPEYNVIINAGGTAGTFTNSLNAGVVLNYRLLGTLIDMYVGNKMTPSLREELAMMSVENRVKRLLCGSDWSLNLYIGAEERMVLNNYRIEGDSDYHAESAFLVYDLKAGIALRYKRAVVDFGMVQRSSEWRSTLDGSCAGPHRFASLSVTVGYKNFADLSKTIAQPIRHMFDANYRREIDEKRAFKRSMAKEGIAITFDDDGNPSTPEKSMTVRCGQ